MWVTLSGTCNIVIADNVINRLILSLYLSLKQIMFYCITYIEWSIKNKFKSTCLRSFQLDSFFSVFPKEPDLPVSGLGDDASEVGVKAHREDQHVEREEQPVVDEFVVGGLWQALKWPKMIEWYESKNVMTVSDTL